MPRQKRLSQYEDVFFALVEEVSRGGSRTIEFETASAADSSKTAFYNFRTALRQMLHDAEKVSITSSPDNKTLKFQRKTSVYTERLRDNTHD